MSLCFPVLTISVQQVTFISLVSFELLRIWCPCLSYFWKKIQKNRSIHILRNQLLVFQIFLDSFACVLHWSNLLKCVWTDIHGVHKQATYIFEIRRKNWIEHNINTCWKIFILFVLQFFYIVFNAFYTDSDVFKCIWIDIYKG